jgi:hypothetical protein
MARYASRASLDDGATTTIATTARHVERVRVFSNPLTMCGLLELDQMGAAARQF